MFKIIEAETEAHYRRVRELIAEYIAWDVEMTNRLGLDAGALVEFQYGRAADEIPGEYAAGKGGCLLIAADGDEVGGCGALRRLGGGGACELKRLYVSPAHRGESLGLSLATGLVGRARRAGYRTMHLETAAFMKGALSLYHSLGFEVSPPHYEIPEAFREITIFMRLNLQNTNL